MSRRIEIPPRDASAPVRVPGTQSAPKKPSGVFNERHTSAQDPLYRAWIASAQRLVLTFDDGSEMGGVLEAYDTYALHLRSEADQPILVFKQSLRSITPRLDDAASGDTPEG
ncbi:MAG: RNA chaperone Hfq [Firmicutes bacterium]|nr:RNA chaperone Hfq [Bacillota bacterium]